MRIVKLTDICRPKQWKTISSKHLLKTGYPVYGANGIIGYHSEYNHKDPTLLITCRGATCGSINISKPKSYINGNAMALDHLHTDVDLMFLYFYLKSIKFNDIISGSAQPQITRQGLDKLQIPLPPLSEQKHIAEVLDKADALRQKNKELLEEYNALQQAVFLEMFGDPVSNPMGWEKRKLEEVCTKITDGEHGTVKRQESGRLYLMARNVRDNYLDLKEVSYISEDDHLKIYKRCNAEPNDVLLVCVGATIGRASIVPQIEEFSLARSVALLKPNKTKLTSHYLYSMIRTDFFQGIVKANQNSSAQAGLYTGKIKSIEIPTPPIDLQNKFADIIENIEQQKEKVKESLEYSEELFGSLVQGYFRGNN